MENSLKTSVPIVIYEIILSYHIIKCKYQVNTINVIACYVVAANSVAGDGAVAGRKQADAALVVANSVAGDNIAVAGRRQVNACPAVFADSVVNYVAAG